MRRSIVCAFAALLLAPGIAVAGPGSPAPVQTQVPGGAGLPSPDTMRALAQRCLTDVEAGKIDRALLDDAASVALSHDALAKLARQLAPIGKPSAFVLTYTGLSNGVAANVYRVTSADGHSFVMYGFSYDVPGGKVAALHFGPVSPQ